MTKVLFRVVVSLILLFLIMPTFIVIPISFSANAYMRFPPDAFSLQWYKAFFTSIEWLRAAWASFRVGALTVVFSLLLGVPAAWVLVRQNVPGRKVINALIMWPLAAPVIVLALGLYGILLSLGILNTVFGLAAGHTVLGVPFVIITFSASLRGLDRSVEEAARNLGASKLQTFFLVVLPQMKPALLTGSLFAFLTSWDELVMALFLTGTDSKTLPRQMWSTLQFDRDPTLAAVSTLLLLVPILGFAIAWLWKSRLTRKTAVSSVTEV